MYIILWYETNQPAFNTIPHKNTKLTLWLQRVSAISASRTGVGVLVSGARGTVVSRGTGEGHNDARGIPGLVGVAVHATRALIAASLTWQVLVLSWKQMWFHHFLFSFCSLFDDHFWSILHLPSMEGFRIRTEFLLPTFQTYRPFFQTKSWLAHWAIQVGLLTPLTFAWHRLSPLVAFTSGAYFLHNGRWWQWICKLYTANFKSFFWRPVVRMCLAECVCCSCYRMPQNAFFPQTHNLLVSQKTMQRPLFCPPSIPFPW